MNNQATMNRVVAVLPAADIQAAITFYTELGFTATFTVGDYAGVVRDGVELHLFGCTEKHIAEWTSCRIAVGGIESLYDDYAAKKVVHPNGTLTVKPWGTKEFAILDPSGVCITFFEPAPVEVPA